MAAILDDEAADLRRANAELQRRLDETLAERDEAEAQKTAMAEVLAVINASPGDLAPVFDTILERATQLCEATYGQLATYDGEFFRFVAVHGEAPYVEEQQTRGLLPPSFGIAWPRIVRGEGVVHIVDVMDTDLYRTGQEGVRRGVDIGGIRSLLSIALRKEDTLLGVLSVYRQEVRPFSEKQIALLQNFATQAVIAMENARLITETREALEQQTATAEVLQVINASPGNLAPVFDTMLEKATRLSDAAFGVMQVYDGGQFRTVATRSMPPALAEFLLHTPRQPTPHSAVSRILDGEDFVHFEDMTCEPAFLSGDPRQQAFVKLGGTRTYVAVALRKDDRLLGTIATYRREVRPFSDKQIALLQSFAAQAVIAIENARLISETREALEQQTATAEVLQIINSSPGDLNPVFDAMLERAMRLCEAKHGYMYTHDGERLRTTAVRGEPQFVEFMRGREPVISGTPLERAVRSGGAVFIADCAQEEVYRTSPGFRQLVDVGGIRTGIILPLFQEAAFLGSIHIFRREVRPFTDKQIALLQNFAAQAVIAMENARLIAKTREALDQQTATAEVLQVINSSPGELAPVFDAMLEKALSLCDAVYGHVYTYDGERVHPVAIRGEAGFIDWLQQLGPYRPGPGSPMERTIRGERIVHVADALQEEAYRTAPGFKKLIDASGIRTGVTVALRKEGALFGALNIYRKEVRPFSDKQIALLQTFAAQAVIAIENARLITETQEALEQQTATAEVLQVINASPGNLAPVFDAMLEKAMELCGVAFGALVTYRDGCFHIGAVRGPREVEEWATGIGPIVPEPGSAMLRLVQGEDVTQVVDAANDDNYRLGGPVRKAMVDIGGYRTLLAVSLRKHDALLGALYMYRQEVRPFADKQVALLQNFAQQAVIAIENSRLLTETREALEQQTATAEVLQVINSSPGDLTPVFDAMLEKALHLCEAAFGLLHTYDGERFCALAIGGVSGAAAEPLHEWVADPGSALEQIVHGDRVVHIRDVVDTDAYRSGVASRLKLVKLTGARTALWVALRKDDVLIGVFVIYRREVRPFSDKQIALLQNFAAQAVIAMENARLITETREALEQQTATAEVLQVINSSPGVLQPVFEAILERAHSLCGVSYGSLQLYDGEKFRAVAVHGLSGALADRLRQGYSPGATNPVRRLVDGERFVHTPDLAEIDDPMAKSIVELGATRTLLWVALRKDEKLLGLIAAARLEVRPFSDKHIALLENFAAQAVIAMENARLITETREALEQQTATAEILQVINSSPGDLTPVFEAMLERATRLCEATHGHVWTFDGEQLHAVAVHGDSPFVEWLRQHNPVRPIPGSAADRIARGEGVVHMADRREEDAYRDDPIFRGLVDTSGVRASLSVALRKDETLLGMINVYRQEVRPFSDQQIALLENFAAQAVIAIDNARLITETREALEQQTATAEVLQVINSSPGDLAPVFDAILDKAQRVCGVDHAALELYDGQRFYAVAVHGASDKFAETLRHGYRASDSPAGRAMLEGQRFAQIADAAQIDHIAFRTASEVDGIRTVLFVPLRRDDTLLGMIASARREVRPFSEKEIALLENFAAQAVIAMESARLITETREALEQQTATAEVLQVINSSPGDLQPVFDAMLDKALGLCAADFGVLWTYDGERIHATALRGVLPTFADFLTRTSHSVGPDNAHGRLLRGERVVHIADIAEDKAYRSGDPIRRTLIELGGGRTLLAVPLRKDDTFLGDFVIYRQEVRPFTDKQIALLQNFAAQAVIAMENARLLTETREALDQQTATAEVLQVINASPGDLAPVFEAMVHKAITLCDAASGTLWTCDGDRFEPVAVSGASRLAEWFRQHGPTRAALDTPGGRLLSGERVVHIADVRQDPAYRAHPRYREMADIETCRTFVAVGLRKEDTLLGMITVYRQEIRPFSDKQVALLQNFAAQAVIAMENARLLDEIRQRQAELRVTFENMVHGVAMFDEELRLAAWNRNFQELLDLPDQFLAAPQGFDEYIRYLTERGEFGQSDPETEIRRLRERLCEHYRFERTRPDGTVIEVRHNPMPDGGVVLIYSDITERKRSEAEIHAARDAAEAAYRDLKAAQANLIQAEKMASLGQLTAGIAHEIKNPLNFVNNFAGLSVELLDELKETAAPAITALDDDKRAEIDETIEMLTGNLEKIAEHGKRADNIVKSMLEHSRGSSGERRSVDLNGLIEESLNLAYHGARAQDQSFNITLERDFGQGITPIELVPQDITRVCLNLFSNGFYAATKRQKKGDDPKFQPTLKVTTRDLGDVVEIRIRDNGIGIAPEIKDKLFQPFFTTKPTGEGTGLGLSISYDIVTQQHGGTIEVDSRVGEFSEFTVRLPRAYRATLSQAVS